MIPTYTFHEIKLFIIKNKKKICIRDTKQRGSLRPFQKLALPQSPIQAAPLKFCTLIHFFIIYMHLIKVILIGCTVYIYIYMLMNSNEYYNLGFPNPFDREVARLIDARTLQFPSVAMF